MMRDQPLLAPIESGRLQAGDNFSGKRSGSGDIEEHVGTGAVALHLLQVRAQLGVKAGGSRIADDVAQTLGKLLPTSPR